MNNSLIDYLDPLNSTSNEDIFLLESLQHANNDKTAEAETLLKKKIHIRVQQRSAKKNITTVEGLSPDNAKKIGTQLKTKLGCSGTVKGDILQFSGDQRSKIVDHLLENNIVEKDNLVVHGF